MRMLWKKFKNLGEENVPAEISTIVVQLKFSD